MPAAPPTAYSVIAFDPAGHWEYQLPEAAGAQPTSLSATELTQLDAVLTADVARLNARYEQEYASSWAATPTPDFARESVLIDLPRYVRQYLPLHTPTGQRLVWVKLLRQPHPSWRTELAWVLDGGNYHVSGLYELALGNFRWLQPNGSA